VGAVLYGKRVTACKDCGMPNLWWWREQGAPRGRTWTLRDRSGGAIHDRLDAAHLIARKQAEFNADRRKDRRLEFKDIDRQGWHSYVREAWTIMPQSNMEQDKFFVLERLRYEGARGAVHFGGDNGVGEKEYRLAYWIRRPDGSWVFGQYATMMPIADLEILLAQARSDGTIQDDGSRPSTAISTA